MSTTAQDFIDSLRAKGFDDASIRAAAHDGEALARYGVTDEDTAEEIVRLLDDEGKMYSPTVFKNGKRFDKIFKRFLAARSKDATSHGELRGFEYVKGDWNGYTGRLTATDGHRLFRYYLTEDEAAYFERCELPKHFDNGKSIYFADTSDADSNAWADYPQVEKVIPRELFDRSIPAYFDARVLTDACAFLSAVDGKEVNVFFPEYSTNFRKFSLNGPAMVVRKNAMALIMPCLILEDFEPTYCVGVPHDAD